MGAELGRGREGQVRNLHRQVQSKDLRTFSVNQKGGLKETDLNEIIGKVQSALPLLLRSNGDIAANITFSKKDLKILADSAVMVDALLSLVRSALSAMPHGGALSLSTTQVDFKNRSILDGNSCTYGACAAITVAGRSRGINERWPKGKNLQPTMKTGTGKDSELSTAYGIIKQYHGCMRIESAPGHGTTVTVYLPLASLDDTLQSARSATEVA